MIWAPVVYCQPCDQEVHNHDDVIREHLNLATWCIIENLLVNCSDHVTGEVSHQLEVLILGLLAVGIWAKAFENPGWPDECVDDLANHINVMSKLQIFHRVKESFLCDILHLFSLLEVFGLCLCCYTWHILSSDYYGDDLVNLLCHLPHVWLESMVLDQ